MGPSECMALTFSRRDLYKIGPKAQSALSFSAAQVVLFCGLFLAPLAFGSVQPWAWGALIIVVTLALLLWGLGCGLKRCLQIHWTPFYIPPIALLVFAIVQWVGGFSVDPIGTREAVVKGVAYLTIFFLTATLFTISAPKCWLYLGTAVAAFTFGLAVFAIIQFFASPDKIYGFVVPAYGSYIFGPYVNHNSYAGLMELLLPIAAAFWWTCRRGHWQRWFGGFACLVTLISVVLSGSRAGTASLALEAALFSIVLATQSYGASRLKFIVSALLLAGLFYAVCAWIVPTSVAARYEGVTRQDASSEIRKHLTLDALRIFAEHPVSGIGLGAFETAYTRHQSFASDLVVDYAHNDIAQLLAETGSMGASALAAGLGGLLATTFNAVQRRMIADRTCYGVAACIALLGIAQHSWFDFNLHIASNVAWFAAVAGVASAGTSHRP